MYRTPSTLELLAVCQRGIHSERETPNRFSLLLQDVVLAYDASTGAHLVFGLRDIDFDLSDPEDQSEERTESSPASAAASCRLQPSIGDASVHSVVSSPAAHSLHRFALLQSAAAVGTAHLTRLSDTVRFTNVHNKLI